MRVVFRPLLGVLLVSSLLFNACRSDDKPAFDPWDNSVTVRISGDPESLDYLTITDGKSTMIYRQINMPFADFDPATQEMVPVLAKTLPVVTEITEGDRAGLVSYEFEIRDEAVWPNGSPVTGNDILFTYKLMHNPIKPSMYAGQLRRVKEVVVNAENPKKFTLYSQPYVMAGPSYSNMAPLPAYVYDPNKVMDQFSLDQLRTDTTLKNNADLQGLAEAMGSAEYLRSPEIIKGSGPYELSEWTTGQEVVLTKKANWWGDQFAGEERLFKAMPNKVVYKIVPDINAAVAMMKNDEIDVISMMDWTTFLNEKEKADFQEQVNFFTPDLYAMRMMNFNTSKGKLSDKRVRRAITHLFDFDEINEAVWYGYSQPIASPVYPTKSAYNTNLNTLKFDAAKAKSLLEDAGWKDTNGNGIVDKEINGETVEMELELAYGNGNADYEAVATIFADDAKEAGVNIKPRPMESSAYLAHLKSREFDMAFSAIRDYPFNMDPAGKWHTRGPSNYMGFGTPESDALIIKLRQTVDPAEQDKLSKELQAIIYDEQPGIFIGVDKDRMVVDKRFGEITVYGLSPGFSINEFNGNAAIAVSSSQN